MPDKEKTSKEVQENPEEDKSELIEIIEKEKEESIDEPLSQIDENRFREFLEPVQSSAPVLEEVTAAQESPVFIGGFAQGSDSGEGRREGDSISYSHSRNNKNEEKYEVQSTVGNDIHVSFPSHVDMETIGRDLHHSPEQISPVNTELQELRRNQETSGESYVSTLERTDMMEVGKERPKPREYKINQ
jgi:hypothetical protein